DPEVVGRVGGEGAQRRGHRDGAHPRPRRGRARRAFAVGGGGPVFELAFGHFAAVGVDRSEERRVGDGYGGRRGGVCGGGGGGGWVGMEESVEGFGQGLGFGGVVGGSDPEVVGRVGGEGAQRRGHRDGAHPRPRRGRARRAFAVGGGGPVFELAFGHFAAVGVD